MGIFLNIVELINDIKAAADSGVLSDDGVSKLASRGKQYSSIAQRASEGTLQFPVLVSNSIDIETAQNICKALERNYTTFAQIAFSHTPSDNWNKNWTAADYIKKFHQNMDTGGSRRNDIMKAYNASLSLMDSYNVIAEDDTCVIFGATYESATKNINATNKEQLFDVMEHVRHDILNNKYIPKTEVIYNFKDKKLNEKYNNTNVVKEVTADEKFDYSKKKDGRQFAYNKSKDDRQFDYTKSKDERQFNNDNKKFEYTKQKDTLTYRSTDLNKNMLTDNDVKKANELVSTTLHVRIRLVNDKSEDMGIVDFMVGIKCIMHPVKSEDIVINMVNACRNSDTVFNFLRWTTGEISFFKDFLLNIKEIEMDMTNRKSDSSPWWLALKRRKSLSRLKDTMFIGKRILPNATIVISAEEAEFIKTEYGYDLYNPIFFNKIMNSYFLLGFVIVDNSTQIAHFLFEDQGDFQTVTFSALEKSNVSDERKFKEMLKVVNRM